MDKQRERVHIGWLDGFNQERVTTVQRVVHGVHNEMVARGLVRQAGEVQYQGERVRVTRVPGDDGWWGFI